MVWCLLSKFGSALFIFNLFFADNSPDMHRSFLCRCGPGKVLYEKGASALPRDFYDACGGYFGMKLHHPTYIGVRPSQVRGIYLSHSAKDGVEANQPIFTIPLDSVQRVSTVAHHPLALPRVTLDNVRDVIHFSEMKLMAPQLYLGLQIASIASNIPDFKRMSSSSQIDEARQRMVQDIIPWIRILDDEDFNEQFIFGMYGMALDSWQRQSFNEINDMFNKSISAIHHTLKLPFTADHLRRMTRLVIARSEHVPLPSVYEGHRFLRRLRRLVRVLQRNTTLPSEVGVVPMLDLINHSNRPNVAAKIAPSALLGGRPAATVYSIAKILPGQELCRHYNFALSRPNALFRYGFLPFDLISVIENDAIHEHLIKNQDMLEEEMPAVVQQREAEFKEIARLEQLFREARSKAPPPSSAEADGAGAMTTPSAAHGGSSPASPPA